MCFQLLAPTYMGVFSPIAGVSGSLVPSVPGFMQPRVMARRPIAHLVKWTEPSAVRRLSIAPKKSRPRRKRPVQNDSLKLDSQLCFPLYAASRLVVQAYAPLLEQLDLTYP